MRRVASSLLVAFIAAGCAPAPVPVPVPPPNPVVVAVAGRPVVFLVGCPERIKVASSMSSEFAVEFPGLKADDSEFQAFARGGFSSGLASGARGGKVSIETRPCDTLLKPGSVGFSPEGVRLLLDTTRLDTAKVYVARSPVVFFQPDSATRAGFFGKVVPDGVKLIAAELGYGLYDPRTRKLIGSGDVRGLSSTGSVSSPEVVRDDWKTAVKRLGFGLLQRIDSSVVQDTAAKGAAVPTSKP